MHHILLSHDAFLSVQTIIWEDKYNIFMSAFYNTILNIMANKNFKLKSFKSCQAQL
jgi:hypothetical protein